MSGQATQFGGLAGMRPASPAPLCPAGHLPHGWGDLLGAPARHLPISPLVEGAARADRPFSPAGRRWPAGLDEGAFATRASVADRSGRSHFQSLTPSSVLSDICSPLGRRGNAPEAQQ
jgi:hypothetical protein